MKQSLCECENYHIVSTNSQHTIGIFEKYYLHCHQHLSTTNTFIFLLNQHQFLIKFITIPSSTLFLLVLWVQWMELISIAVLQLQSANSHGIDRGFVLRTV